MSRLRIKILDLMRGKYCLLVVAAALGCTTTALAQPANDNFANAFALAGMTGATNASNVGGTKETGEPDLAGNPGGASVWFAWRAPFSGPFSFSTLGSDFDTILGVYTGNSIAKLTSVVENDDSPAPGGGVTSLVNFTANAGTVYHIAVDGFGAASGNIILSWGAGRAAGGFQFTSPLYLFGESENGFGTIAARMQIAGPAIGPRVTVTRFGDAAGRASVDYVLTNLMYANTGRVWTVVTNIFMTNLDGAQNPYTNYFFTNIAVATRYQDNEFGQFVYLPVDNTATNTAVTNENGRVSTAVTNMILDTNDFPFTVCNVTQPPSLITNIVVNTNPPLSTNILITNTYCTLVGFTDLVPTAIPAPPPLGDYIPDNGTIVFDDYQMSVDYFPNFVPYALVIRPPQRKEVNRLLVMQISNPQLDPLEDPSIGAPTTNAFQSAALINILDQSTPAPFPTAPNPEPPSWAVPGTNVFNFEYATIRCTEDVAKTHVARIYVRRSSRDFSGSTSVDYRINFLGPVYNDSHDLFRRNQGFPLSLLANRYNPEMLLQAGSDYASPTNVGNITPANTYVSTLPDYTNVVGTLNWGPGDGTDQFIDIPIVDDQGVEFNEDFLVQLYFNGGATPQLTDKALGFVQNCVVTILFDDQPAGAVDRTYNPDGDPATDPPYNLLPGANDTVQATAIQGNGQTIFAGNFTAYNTVPRNRIARANLDGSIDKTFNPPGGADNFISSLLLDSGNIWVGGGFTSFNGVSRRGVARILGNGSLDTTFNPGTGGDAAVWAMAKQTNGIIVAGDFTTFNGLPHPHIVRLLTNGVVDTSFNVGLGPNDSVYAVTAQNDGKILIGGRFTSVAGTAMNRIARLNPDGSLDATFNPNSGADDVVQAITLQADGKILIGGSFKHVSDITRPAIARLSTSGALDLTFDPVKGFDNTVFAITLQPDGNILVGGKFNSYNQTRRMSLARVLTSGLLDTTFMDSTYNQFAGLPKHYLSDDAEQHPFILSVSYNAGAVATNLIIGGSFSRVGGGAARDDIRFRNNIAKIVDGATPGPGSIQLDRDAYTADENGGQLFVRMTRDNGFLGPAQVTVAGVDRPAGPGAAVNGTDYTFNFATPVWSSSYAATWQLQDGTFGQNNGGSQSVDPSFLPIVNNQVFVFPVDNTIIDGNRSFDLDLINPGSGDLFTLGGEKIPTGVAVARAAASVTIVNDDTDAGTLSFVTPAFTVGEAGTNAIVSIIRTGGLSGTITVGYNTSDGTAHAPSRYKARSGTLTFGPTVNSNFFSVPVVDDSVAEDDQFFNVNLFGVTGGGKLGLTNAVVTIIDNDSPNGRLNLSAATYTNAENAGSALITVKRSGGSLGTLSVYYATTNGTARAGIDYVGVTNLLTWNPGDNTPKTFSVPILDNQLVDGTRAFNLRLFSPVLNGATNFSVMGGASNSVVYLLDDDAYGAVAFSANVYSVNENGGPAYITVRRTSGIAQSVTVNFATSGGNAVAGYQYTPTNGVLAFAPGEISKTFTVSILDNPYADGTGWFVGLVLSNASPVASLGFPQTAILNIFDDETYNEPAGSPDTALDRSAGFNGDVFALALQTNGMILAAGDFTIANGTPRNRLARLNVDGSLDPFFSDPTSGITNGAVRSLISQSDSKVVVGGFFTNVNGIVANHVARLNYDGTLDSTFNPGAGADNSVFALAEAFIGGARKIMVGGGFVTFNGFPSSRFARLNDDGTVDSSFNLGSGADASVFAIVPYPTNSVRSGQVLIAGDFTTVNATGRGRIARLNADGSVDLTFNPATGANDSIRAIALTSDEKVLIGGLFTNVNGVARSRIARLNADGSLDTTFNPGLGANDFVSSIVVQRDNRILVGGQFTFCNGVTRNHITRLNTDGSVDPQINFGLGADSLVNTIQLQADDKILLGGGFTHYDGVGYNRFVRLYGRSITGSGRFEFDAPNYTVNENGTNATVTVRRRGGTSGAPSGNVLVTMNTLDGTAHAPTNYIAIATNLAFPPGEVIAKVAIPIFDDAQINPDRTLSVWLSNPQPQGDPLLGFPSLGSQASAVLTIINDDSAVSFASASYSVNEDTSVGAAVIQINRTGSTNGSSSVDFVTATNGTALIGINYQPVTNTLFFSPGDTYALVQVPVIHDPTPQGNKTVSMILSNCIGSVLLDPSQATLNILDIETAPGTISFASTNFFVADNAGSGLITLNRTNGHSGIISVQFATTNGSAIAGIDYVSTNGSVVFADGETTKSFTVPVISNNVVQNPKNLLLVLSNPTAGATISGSNSVPLTILNHNVGIGFSSRVYSVSEGAGSVALSVVRLNGSNGLFSINYATTNGSATAGIDYSATAGTLNFANGETLKTISVPVIQGTTIKGDRTFNMLLSNLQPPSAGQLITPSTTVTILNDISGFFFSNSVYTVSEAATNLVVTIARTNAAVAGTNTVAVFTSDGTATAGVRYTPLNTVLAFTNGEASKTIIIPILEDNLVNGDETFNLTLTNATAGAQILSPSNAVVTIVDDDSGINFSSAAYTISEAGVSAAITVRRSGVLTNTVSVSYSTANGSAVDGVNYIGVSGTLTFTNGETTKTFNVQVIDDSVIRGDRTVLLSLSRPFGQVSLQPPSAAVLTIKEADGSLIVPAGAALLTESGAGAPNGTIDPGETVSLRFAFRNSVGLPTTNLVATLLAGNGVTLPSGPKNYGALIAGGAPASQIFSFTASGTNGAPVTAVFQLQDGPVNLGTNVFFFGLGTNNSRYTNSAVIAIRDNTNGLPYPSVINISNLGGVVTRASVTLSNLAHTFPSDIDVLLASPAGQSMLLLANNGGGNSITNLTLTLDQNAATPVPVGGQLVTATNKPNPNLPVPTFPSPAPPSPYATNLAACNGSNPNGPWSLFVMDSRVLNTGSIAGGWVLSLATANVVEPTVNLITTVDDSPKPVVVGSNLTYTITVANYGPSSASAVSLANTLPPSATFISATPGYTLTNNVLTYANLGNLALGTSTSVTILVRPNVVGTITNISTAAATETDPFLTDNTALTTSTVVSPSADLALEMFGPSGPVSFGQPVAYTLVITNAGPATATASRLTDTMPSGVNFVSATPNGYALVGNTVVFTNIGDIGSGDQITATVVVQPTVIGTLTNSASVSSSTTDPLKLNNSASVKTVVQSLTLSATRAGANIIISWPAAASDFVLESANDLHAPVTWSAVTTPPPQQVGDQMTVTITPTNAGSFFRLHGTAP
jgi:uncharacterized delta-60 repeat protein/uncharacterized repeat protein (TIGR01451 family)